MYQEIRLDIVYLADLLSGDLHLVLRLALPGIPLPHPRALVVVDGYPRDPGDIEYLIQQ